MEIWQYIVLVMIAVSAIIVAYAIRYWKETGKMIGLIKFLFFSGIILSYPMLAQDDFNTTDFVIYDNKPIVSSELPKAADAINDFYYEELSVQQNHLLFLQDNLSFNNSTNSSNITLVIA